MLYLSIPSSKRKAAVVADKEPRLLGEWDRNGECRKEKEAGKEVGEGSKMCRLQPSRKTGSV